MQSTDPFDHPGAGAMPLQLAIELQDDLMTACNDLERLLGLVASTCHDLSGGFHAAIEMIVRQRERGGDAAAMLTQLEALLARSVIALQFDDMATQLITHTRRRLRHNADCLAAAAMGDDDEDGAGAVVEAAPQRPNPVTQDEMDAGSVELF